MNTGGTITDPTAGSIVRSRTDAWLAALWRPVAAVAGGYYFGALLGFALRFPETGISFFWPPTAVLTAALLLNPPRTWGWLLAGAFGAHAAAHVQNGVPLTAWPIQFAANAAQSLLSAYLVRRFSDPARPFADLHRTLGFIICAGIAAPGVASLVAAEVYVMLGWSADFLSGWRFRTVSNGIAALILVPAIVLIRHWIRSGAKGITAWRVAEFGVVLAGLLASHGVVGYVDQRDALSLALALYAPAPFLLWATVRFGGAGLSIALLTTTLLTISSALQERAFAGATPEDAIVGVQLFLSTMAVPLILIAGLLEQNEAEHRALVEMERRNSATFRALPDLMFVQTRDGVYVGHYAPSKSQLLVAPELFLGRNMSEVLPPDLAARFQATFRTVTPDVPSVIEYSMDIGGELRDYEARVIGLDSDRVLSIVRDITDRRRSENALFEAQRQYALATAAGGIGVWHLDVKAGAVRVEGGLLPSLGYSASEVTALPDWYRLVCPEDLDDLRTRLMAFIGGTSPGYESECRLRCKDGSTRWILSRAAMADRKDGIATQVTGTYVDITARKEAEDALKRAHDTMARMGRVTALAELTASIAHELNQPLAALATNASTCLRWLDGAVPEDELRGALRDLVADSRRAGQIVRRTREMFANRSVSRAPTDLNDVIRSVLDLARPRLRDAAVQLDLQLDESLPIVDADKVQVQQVVMNLVLNAIDAMLEADARPRILSLKSRRNGDGAVVSVADTGAGWASADPGHVFEPFYTTKADGIGIGLAISRSIVEAHGGSIWASAEEGRGATFSFTLPIHAPVEALPA